MNVFNCFSVSLQPPSHTTPEDVLKKVVGMAAAEMSKLEELEINACALPQSTAEIVALTASSVPDDDK